MVVASNAVKGFTLMELMMTLAIAAILVTVAVPSFRTFIQNSKLTKQVNLLAASVATARGEAAKRGARVVLCQSNNSTAATPDCDGTAGTWSNGWVVFVDSNNNLTVDVPADVLAVFHAEQGVDMLTDVGTTLAFNSDGSTTAGDAVSFAVCDSRGLNHGKEMTVATTGRASSKDATTCTP